MKHLSGRKILKTPHCALQSIDFDLASLEHYEIMMICTFGTQNGLDQNHVLLFHDLSKGEILKSNDNGNFTIKFEFS